MISYNTVENAYTEPKFEIVSVDETDRIFFAASGGPKLKLSSITKTDGSW